MWLETEVLSRWYWTVAKTGMVTGDWERRQMLQAIWTEQRWWREGNKGAIKVNFRVVPCSKPPQH